jgi:hypothetical protein
MATLTAKVAFSFLQPRSASGIAFFMLTIRDAIAACTEHNPNAICDISIYENLIMDMWGNAYLDAAKTLSLRRITEIYKNEENPKMKDPMISKVLVPGMHGIEVRVNKAIGGIVGAEAIGIHILDSGMMNPAKSSSGICFITDRDGAISEHEHQKAFTGILSQNPCEGCYGNHAGCEFCSIGNSLMRLTIN